MIGASREMVSRVMKDLVEMGEVEMVDDRMVLHPGLERTAR
jgi:CRP-like cAMP-binding protein